MPFLNKLKSETSLNVLLPAIITLAGMTILWTVFGYQVASTFVAAVFLVYSIFSLSAFVRTRNTGYLAAALFQFFGALWITSEPSGWLHVSNRLTGVISLLTLGNMIWMQALLFTRRFKWRGREVFELAAQPVEDVTNGFTERPRPAGQTLLNRQDALAFAGFAARRLIAMPYVESDRVVFVPVTMAGSFKFLYPGRRNYRDSTWVSIANDGNVAVNIARKDYLQYKDSLSFDQLCESMGDLFIDFAETVKRGEGERIIDRMNALHINPYT